MTSTIRLAKIHEKEIIRNLLQPYLTKLANFPDENPIHKDDSGVYIYPYTDAYWQEDSRFPYLLYEDGNVAGFALVRKNRDHWEIAEFYIKPEFRRRGFGIACATFLLRKHTGNWRITFNKHNQASRNLWRKLAEHLSRGKVEEGESDKSHDYIRLSVPSLKNV